MRKLTKALLRVALAAHLALAGAIVPAVAAPAMEYAKSGRRPAHAPGSTGFVTTCKGVFSNQNNILQSNTFGTTWVLSGNVVAAPTISSTTATAPDGTATATTLSIPTVTGANAYSFIQQQTTNYAQTVASGSYPQTVSVWIQNTTPGNGVASFFLINSTSTAWRSVPVPNDGRWHQMVMYLPGAAYSAKPFFSMGVDTRDTTQAATTGALTVNIWHAQLTGGRGPAGGQWPYIATTTAAVTATQTIPCTKGLAFRDYTNLQPYGGNAYPLQNASEAWQAGGVSHFFSETFKVGDTYYAMANSTDTTNHNDWYTFSLYSGVNPFALTEVGGSSPVLQIPGSNYTNGTNGTSTNVASYMLHPAYSKTGCTVSATFHKYCVYFSARNSVPNQAVFLAFADTITGPYTWYPNSTTPTPVITFTATNGTSANPDIPGIITEGNVNYLYAPSPNNAALRINVYTSAATDGVTWLFAGQEINPVLSADWDFSGFQAYNDPYPVKNLCGFYELYYTLQASAVGPQNVRQRIGVAISDSPLGPWFKAAAPVIPATSNLYGSTVWLGDTSILFYKGMLVWVGNQDNASNYSAGVYATMRDACAF